MIYYQQISLKILDFWVHMPLPMGVSVWVGGCLCLSVYMCVVMGLSLSLCVYVCGVGLSLCVYVCVGLSLCVYMWGGCPFLCVCVWGGVLSLSIYIYMDVAIWCMNIWLCIFVLRDHMRSVILCFLSLRQDLSLKMAARQAPQQASNPPVSTSYSSWIVGKGAAMMQHVHGHA